ncbi:hypothetical protein F53441_5161 [Fusarium austroafricanum]|uniref:Rhodopsin domain-containing protein n=1 Tax=Fusarium austroafricanum TaxID=2364996 RepID=A0A8H4KK77_9HYPO|nr:hypothetical protein F53441_5161 [Fusarium austroafricanum]
MDPNIQLPSNPDENGAVDILASTAFVISLATIVVLARVYVRVFMIRNLGWDDAFMLFTIALSWAGQGVIFAQLAYGGGKHIGDVDPDIYMTGMKLNFISQPIFLIAICVVKLSVGCALLRIASTKFYRYLILSIMVFMAFYTIGCFFTVVFQCTDIRVLWDPSVPSKCWSQKTLQSLSYTNSALNILTDLLFAIIIPTPMLWKLNVHFRTRMILLGILGLGVFACAAAFTKLGYITNYGKLGDWLWDSRNITIWTSVELNVGIIAGSLPTLRPLFRSFLGSYYGKNSKKTPTTGNSNYGRGTLRSGTIRHSKNWHALSSDRNDDEASSQKAINIGLHEYELRDRMVSPSGVVNQATVQTQIEGRASDDSTGNESYIGQHPSRITKTMVTTIKVTKADSSSSL